MTPERSIKYKDKKFTLSIKGGFGSNGAKDLPEEVVERAVVNFEGVSPEDKELYIHWINILLFTTAVTSFRTKAEEYLKSQEGLQVLHPESQPTFAFLLAHALHKIRSEKGTRNLTNIELIVLTMFTLIKEKSLTLLY